MGCTAIRLVKKPVIEQDKCIGCGICELVCTRGAIGKM
ncbi:4Fe-4S binding protein [Vulcanisaeta sp. EB80]